MQVSDYKKTTFTSIRPSKKIKEKEEETTSLSHMVFNPLGP